jgi:NAD(P)-dependent dehydrogenase (short-subunit alcohol dehydrogenase family)
LALKYLGNSPDRGCEFCSARALLPKASWQQPHWPATDLMVALDVTGGASITTLRTEIGPIDVLVNNAGVDYDTDQTVLAANLVRVRQIFETNLFGAWAMAQAFAPDMRRRGWGRIVNVSSVAASLADRRPDVPRYEAPGYSASKTALNAPTRLLAAELEGTGVLVNSVSPGWVATDMGGSGVPCRKGARV